MKKIANKNFMNILKIFHLLGMILWSGGAVSNAVLIFQPQVPRESIEIIDRSLIIPGGWLLLITGIGYSFFTKFGFKKLWISLKWIIFLCLVASGILLPPQKSIAIVQIIFILIILFLSVFKWSIVRKKKKSTL